MKQTLIVFNLAVFALASLISSCQRSQENKFELTVIPEKMVDSNQEKDSLACKVCLYDSLSFIYNYEVSYYRFYDDEESNDSCWALIKVYNKEDLSLSDSLIIRVLYGYYEFPDCQDSRSCITDFKNDSEVIDNHFGEFAVADFNFDKTEDFAIIQEAGGNGGPLYCFVIGDGSGHFELDRFLTDSMHYFPSEILASQNRLVTYVHSGAYGLGKDTYEYSRQTKTWKQIQSRVTDFYRE